jgi:cell shape-determining protein MreD
LFVLMDLRDTPRHSVPEDHVKQPHFHLLLLMLWTLKNPSILMLAIWV